MLNNSVQHVGGAQEQHAHTLLLEPAAWEDIKKLNKNGHIFLHVLIWFLTWSNVSVSGKERHTADSLVGRACQGSARAFYGVQATIQPLHTLVNCTKLAHANALQLQELTLIAGQHEGLDSSPLPDKQMEGLVVKPKTFHKNTRHLQPGEPGFFLWCFTKYGSASTGKWFCEDSDGSSFFFLEIP